jgi:hypothetical protein
MHSSQGGQMTTLYTMLFLPTPLFLSFLFNDCQMLRLCSDTDGEKTLVLEETIIPVPLHPPQILHGLARGLKPGLHSDTPSHDHTPLFHIQCVAMKSWS